MHGPSSLVLSDECLNEELRWWWLLKRKVFESAAPSIAFGTESVWKIVSQMRAHVLHAYSSCHPPQDDACILSAVETTGRPIDRSRQESDPESDHLDSEPPSPKKTCLELPSTSTSSSLPTSAPQPTTASIPKVNLTFTAICALPYSMLG